MPNLSTLSDLVNNTSTGLRFIIAAALLVSILLGGAVTAKAVVQLPAKYDAHAEVTKRQTATLDRMLCITVADHRKMDWRLCYINPTQVVPTDDTNATH